MARRGCCGEEGRACEALNVVLVVASLLFALIAAGVSMASEAELKQGCQGLGAAGERMQEAFNALPACHVAVVMLDIVGAVAIWLSFFHCKWLSEGFVECMTKSSTLCVLRVLVMMSFLGELIASQVLLVWRCVLSSISFLCGAGEGMVSQAQDVVTSARTALQQSAAAGKAHHSSISLGFAGLFAGLDLPQYCKSTEGRLEEQGTRKVIFACFCALLAQVFIAMALSGEKERVTVHEAREKGMMAFVSREAEAVNGLLSKSETVKSLEKDASHLRDEVSSFASHNAYLKSASDEVHRLVGTPDLFHSVTSEVGSAVGGAVAGAQAASWGSRFGETLGGSRGAALGREIGQAMGSSIGHAAGYEAGLHPGAAASLGKLAQSGLHTAGEASHEMRFMADVARRAVH